MNTALIHFGAVLSSVKIFYVEIKENLFRVQSLKFSNKLKNNISSNMLRQTKSDSCVKITTERK